MSTLPHTNEPRLDAASRPTDWRETLASRMADLRGSVVRLLWLRAVGVLLIVGVLGIVAVGALDWWLRPSQPAGRWALSGLLLLLLAALAGWFVSGARQYRRISTAAVARQLERLIPSLGDRLSSAVAIAEHSRLAGNRQNHAPAAGKLRERELGGGLLGDDELSARAVRQAAEELQAARPERTLDRRPAQRLAFCGIALLGALIVACIWRPATASLLAHRLIVPSSQAAWPRRHYLELSSVPDRMHAGTELEVFVRNRRGTIPDDTEVRIRDSQGREAVPVLRMSGTAGVVRIEGMTEDFAIRARGGDDDTMPWQTVRVVPAPRIEDYRVRLLPPAYTGLEPQTLVGDRLSVLAGTEMWIEARVAPPVTEASLVRLDAGSVVRQSPATEPEPQSPGSAEAEEPTQWPAEIVAAGGKLAVGPISLRREGEFAFRWLDTEGISGQSVERWHIDTTEDAAPRVMMNQPSEEVEITAEGLLHLEMQAEDDLGLAESWFEIRGVGISQPARFEPTQYPQAPRDETRRKQVQIRELVSGAEAVPPTQLSAGEVLELTAVAIDIAGQRGESTTRRLRIVSPAALRERLAELERAAMDPLRQAAREQTVAAEQTEAARNRLEGDAQQRTEAEDRLRAAGAAQSAVERRLAEGPQSVIGQLRAAVQMARDNALDAGRLEQLLRELERAVEESIGPAGEGLQRIRQQLAADDEAAAADMAEQTIAEQRQAAETLDSLVDAMRRDDARRSALEELAELEAAQRRLSDASRQVSGAADARAEASRLAQQQRGLAREVEALTQQLRQLADELREQNPDLAAAVAEAAEQLQQGAADQPQTQAAVADAMRSAAAELERGREGRASQLQSEATEQLAEARRSLSGAANASQPPDGEISGQVFAAGVESLRSDQAALVASLQDQADASQAPAQQELAEQAGRLSTDADAPPGFGEAVADAAAEMRLAAALLRRSGSAAAAVDRAQSALARLELIAESLRGTSSDPAPQGSDAAAEQGGEPGAEQQAPPVPLATLRLVRSTQEFLRSRTAQLAAAEQAAAAEPADPLRRAELQAAKRAIAEEQQQLVERIERYAQEMAESQETEAVDAPLEN